jgi:acetolactate synthase-1/2/3 large subunit
MAVSSLGGQSMQAMHVARHGGDRIVAALQAQGVRFLFTLCGGHISPILTAAKARGIHVIDVRDEATAVFAADAMSRLSAVPGVAAVTAGPGLTNAITALKNAQLAQSPVILLGGAAATALQGRGALQDIQQRPVVAASVKRVLRLRRVRDIRRTIQSAFAIATEGVPGPVFIECPVDLLYDEEMVRRWYSEASGKGASITDRLRRFYIRRHADHIFGRGRNDASANNVRVTVPIARDPTIAAAIRALAKAERPLMIVGSQTLAAAVDAANVVAAITRLGIPVYLSGMARGLLGRTHALQMRHHRREALREADCVILAGTPCDFRLDYGRQIRRSSTLIAVNRSRRDAYLNRRPNIGAIGDAGQFLARLAERCEKPHTRWSNWIDQLSLRDASREREIDRQADTIGTFVNPIALLRAIDRSAGDDSIFVADGGDFVSTASYIVRPRRPRAWLDPGTFGTLGVGAGFALGASLCRPDAEVWILFGDGACGYSLVEVDTFVRHGIPVIAIIGNDAGWTQIAREQVKMLKDDVATVLARTAYEEVAAGFGAKGISLKNSADVSEALVLARAAAKAGKPVLINAWLDRTDFREGSISL